MNNADNIIARTVRDPAWLPHRYDPGHDAVHFVSADRQLRRRIPFLIEADLPDSANPRILTRRDALASAPEASPVHFVFHSAFCCSTLLANALDRLGTASALKEPQILNDLVGWRQQGADPHLVGEVLHGVLHLLARPFEPEQLTFVKPSNVVNGLATAMMKLRPHSRAVLLYAPLRVFLSSIARKGMWGRLWVRELLSRQLVDGLVDLGFESRDYLLHTDLQAAAVGWLAQHRLFAEMAKAWPERIRTLESEALVARPAEALGRMAEWTGMAVTAGDITDTVSDVFSRHAKDGSSFGGEERRTDRLSGDSLHAEEIDKVEAWALAVADTARVSLTLPAPLLGS
jgi:hypothetical protein